MTSRVFMVLVCVLCSSVACASNGRVDSLANIYDELAQAALGGDATAALELGTTLRQCAEREKHLIQPYLDSQRSEASDSSRSALERNHARAEARKVEHLIQRCVGLTSAQKFTFIDWLIIAAEGNQLPAIVSLYSSLNSSALTDEQVANYAGPVIETLKNIVDSGDPTPMLSLGKAWTDGKVVPQDLVKAAAYYYAFSLTTTHENASTADQNAATGRLIFDAAVESAGLSNAEIRRAITQGERISKCCSN